MSALTHLDIAEMVRRRYGAPESETLRFVPLVDSAIRHLSYEVAADTNLRQLLLTDPATTTAALDVNGVTDLSPLVTASPRILLECLHHGEIMPPAGAGYPTQPFRMIENSGQGQLKGMFDSLQPKCWLGGNFLYTKRVNNVFMVGPITLEVPRWPTLAELPESLVEKLVHGEFWIGKIEEDAA